MIRMDMMTMKFVTIDKILSSFACHATYFISNN